MKIFDKFLRKKYPGAKIQYFKRNSTFGGAVPPDHYGGAAILDTPPGNDTVYADLGETFLRAIKPHKGFSESSLTTEELDSLIL